MFAVFCDTIKLCEACGILSWRVCYASVDFVRLTLLTVQHSLKQTKLFRCHWASWNTQATILGSYCGLSVGSMELTINRNRPSSSQPVKHLSAILMMLFVVYCHIIYATNQRLTLQLRLVSRYLSCYQLSVLQFLCSFS